MTSSKQSNPTSSTTQPHYQPIPTDPQNQYAQQPQYIIVLPRHPRSPSSCLFTRRVICLTITLLLIGAAGYVFWPSDPDISIVRLHLDRLKFHSLPKISLDITLDLTVKIRNKDFYSIDYDSLDVAIGYRGKQLGYVTSDHGHVKARGSSYVNATLQMDGVEIISDVIYLIEDLAKGSIVFDTTTNISGELGLGLFGIPLEATVSCEIDIDTKNKTITRQNCYPE